MASPLLYLVDMTAFLLSRRHTRIVAALTMSLALTSLTVAQTRIVAPKNKYSVAEDVKLGREAAAQVKKELPMLNDERVDDYVETHRRTTRGGGSTRVPVTLSFSTPSTS